MADGGLVLCMGLRQARSLMVDREVHHLPVTHRGTLVGVLTAPPRRPTMNAPADLPRSDPPRPDRARRYRDDPDALRSLVREDAVHRDVYVSGEVFELEMERPVAPVCGRSVRVFVALAPLSAGMVSGKVSTVLT